MASGTWNTGTWGLNQWGDNANVNVQVTSPNDIPWGNGAYGQGDFGGTDENISASIGSVSVTAEINAGWGSDGWGVENWGSSGVSVLLTGVEATTGLGEDVSWGKQTWGSNVTGWGGEYFLVPEDIMVQMQNNFVEPSLDEGFTQILVFNSG